METIALLGATGSLGRAMGRLLAASGTPYRAVSRSPMALQVRFPPETLATPVIWDPEDPASIEHTLQGVETAIYLVGMPLWEFAKHIPLSQRVIDAARTAGVLRLLLVSSNWAYGSPQVERVGERISERMTEMHPLAAQTAKGRIRAEQEQLFLSAHDPGSLATAVLRIADFYGPYVEASYLWSAFKAAKNGTHAQVMRPADTPHEFVYVPDAARTILRMIDVEDTWGGAWNLGGVGVSTLRTMVETIFAEARQPANYEIPPAWKMRVVAMLNPYFRELREMHYLLEEPVLLDDSALAAALGGISKTPYPEGIRRTLETVRIGR